MNPVSECPVCGTPLSETRYAQIQEKVRSEEQAKYEAIRLDLEADSERRVAAARVEAERRTREHEAQKLALLVAEKDDLAKRIGEYELREAELTLQHEREIKARVGEAERRLRVESEEQISLLRVREQQMGGLIEQLQGREADLVASHEREMQQRLADSERAVRSELVGELEASHLREQQTLGRVQELETKASASADEHAALVAQLNERHNAELRAREVEAQIAARTVVADEIRSVSSERDTLIEKLAEVQRRSEQVEAEHETRLQNSLADAGRVHADEMARQRNVLEQANRQVKDLEAKASASMQEHAEMLTQLADKHAEELRMRESEARSIAQAALADELSAAQAERNAFAERLAAAELRAVNLQDEHEVRIQNALSEAQRAHAEELSQQRTVLDQSKAEELAKHRAEVAEQQEALRKKLQEAERKLEQKTAHELGHWPEVNLGVALREAFPEDEVKPVGKGERGADIIHTVRYKGEPCGRIVIDSKNRQQWRESFVEKLAQDQMDAEAEHAILSTAVFPQGAKDLSLRKDVILAKPTQVVAVVDLLRRTMISNHVLGLSRADEGRKKDRLYQLITSDMYRQSFRTAERLLDQLQEIDTGEYAAHKKVWEHRGKLQRQLERLLRDINTSMSAIVEGTATLEATRVAPNSIREVDPPSESAGLFDAR